ncbi:GNAT family N-acetyltransferase [Kribbella sandramycini]|uniref:GNAT family N-acetyltransferase n=1 Tax=Kribbella sandramycini TaxID=60450 RepID=A0A7Y4KWD8_9ACTN|nr:GNAT family N-acetyltransferase [Kribbella sandramycini]MBB6567576.1 GNAT superfamily N-acetyltransferase [Kribbella sandramycini]NOL39820.1 GNAT family N-acetyltransferase [Kribbella sandramycini]
MTTHSLAQLAERAQTGLTASVLSVPPSLRKALGITGRRIDDGLVLSIAEEPYGMGSAVLGLGFGRPVDAELVADLLDFYRTAGSPTASFTFAPQALPDQWPEIAAQFNLVEHPMFTVLVREAIRPLDVTGAHRARRLNSEHLSEWSKLQQQTFGLKPALGDLLAATLATPGMAAYGVFTANRLVGTGIVRVDGESAQFAVGAVHPDHRNQGIHTALIAARIEHARTAGCRWLFASVTTPDNDEPDPSHRNFHKAGFIDLYPRSTWIRHQLRSLRT